MARGATASVKKVDRGLCRFYSLLFTAPSLKHRLTPAPLLASQRLIRRRLVRLRQAPPLQILPPQPRRLPHDRVDGRARALGGRRLDEEEERL